MRATIMHGAGDVRIEQVPDARLKAPTDAVIRIRRACICGSDLWPYSLMKPDEAPRPMGHEAIGVVEDVGKEVRTIRRGDIVIMPFAYSDGWPNLATLGVAVAGLVVGMVRRRHGPHGASKGAA
jgi:threonine dehydrogenase-like Zn-dependent dehydrogenase